MFVINFVLATAIVELQQGIAGDTHTVFADILYFNRQGFPVARFSTIANTDFVPAVHPKYDELPF